MSSGLLGRLVLSNFTEVSDVFAASGDNLLDDQSS
jgi:hypothetical protein